MNISALSIRTILGFIIALMGLFAFVLSLFTGSIHRELIFDNQKNMMKEVINVAVKDRLKELNETLRELSLSLQNTSEFKNSLKTQNKSLLLKTLNNQFHQYFVTAGIIKLEQLIIFDKQFKVLSKSTDGGLIADSNSKKVCPQLINVAKERKGYQRLTRLEGLCGYNNRPLYAVILPIGGLKLKGYIMVITEPSYNLKQLETNLGMPLKLKATNNEIIFQSSNWPTKETDSLVSNYELRTAAGVSILSVLTAQNIEKLSNEIYQAQLDVFLISGLGTLLIVILSIIVIRRTMIRPLTMLTNKLHNLYSDQKNLGGQLELTGTKEIHNIVEGFNNMSSKLKNLYDSLENMAYTDSLTKLPNRNQFQKSLKSFIKLHEQLNKPFILFLIDLDRFKSVNDTLGHHVGDELLKAVSIRLHTVLRDDDYISRIDQESISVLNNSGMVARLGGDEFSAILTSIHTIEDSIVVANKLVKSMEQPFIINEHQLTIGLSIGIVMYPEHTNEIHSLISYADIAMYNAKTKSCGFSVYNEDQNTHSMRGLRLEQDLFKSIKNKELELYYQPQVSTSDGKVVGAEALIRWQHPKHGLIAPDDFIPIAEQSGFIQPLTEWVLNQALEDYSKDLCSGNSSTISVNLSALNLRDERISQTISKALKKWSIPANVLTIELTESAIMSDPKFAIEILTKLDAMGVSLAIDDFGTGHSSLSYIKKLPVDEIKIDRSFIKNILHDSDDEAIVRAVLELTRRMNLSIVAEGVEDKETYDFLRELGCNIVQGYYFSKPVPLNEYLLWLKQN